MLQQALHQEAQQSSLGIAVALRKKQQQRSGLPAIEQLAGFCLQPLDRWRAGDTPDQQPR